MIKSNKLVHGIGFKGMDYPSYDGEKMLKEYDLWKSMLSRCTEKYWVTHPTYRGTTCSENFKSYTFFYEWCQSQVGFGNRDEKGKYWQLDKDILFKGNKYYSEDTCVFVSQGINYLLTKGKASRGDWPIRMYLSKSNNKFHSRCNNGTGESKHLGFFDTVQEAFHAYKTYKESYIKEVANEYRTQLDPRAYQALLNYTVEITD